MPTVARIRGGDVIPDAFVRCRTYNHSWDEFFPIDLESPAYGWRLSLRCTRCGTERHDNIDFKGGVMGRRYIYAEGYQQRSSDVEVLRDRTVFREELFDRLRAQLEKSHNVGADMPDKVTPITKARKGA
jgi:hypothetical protein